MKSCPVLSSRPGGTVQTPFLSEYQLTGYSYFGTYRNDRASHGVVLGSIYTSMRWRLIALMGNGEVWEPLPDDTMFEIPLFISIDLVSRCGKAEITNHKPELMARVDVLKRLRDFSIALENVKHGFPRKTRTVHSFVKSQNPDEWSTATLSEIAKIFYPKPSIVQIFALHKYLMSSSAEFLADNIYRQTQTFHVRPLNEILDIERVNGMTRIKDGPITKFATKVQNIIRKNKQLYIDSWDERPTSSRAKFEWNENDKAIIRFLLKSLRPVRSSQQDPYSLGQSVILKSVYPKLPKAEASFVHSLLIDLGAIAPWQDLVSIRREFNLEQISEDKSPRVAEQNALVKKFLSSPPTPSSAPAGGVLGPEDFHRTDPLESVRHDFGNLPVYVIDGAEAEELDDGVSVETIPEEPGSHWIHTHIANPASIIHPNHVFSQQAYKQGQTAYFFHRSWPMLPRSLMKAGLSLGSQSALGKPERVITFSAKLNSEGDMVDYKVRAGLVRNVKILTYEAVNLALGYLASAKEYPFGDAPVPTPSSVDLDEQSVAELRIMDQIAELLVLKRFNAGLFAPSEAISEISFSPKPLISDSPTLEPSHFRGFPHLRYSVTNTTKSDCGSRALVSEIMKLGGRVASKFCAERGVPILRRALKAPSALGDAAGLEQLLASRDVRGYVRSYAVRAAGIYFPPGENTVDPKMQWALGVPEGEGYTQATSPLRRYTDLIVQWQVQHALLGSAAPTVLPPFSREWLENYGQKLTVDIRVSNRGQNIHHKFWVMYYIQRVLNNPTGLRDGAPNPLDNLVGNVLGPPVLSILLNEYECEFYVPALGLTAVLGDISAADRDNVPVGTEVPVRIKSMELGVRPRMIFTRR